MTVAYEDGVFVNCPFDDDYRPIFRAIVFAIHDAGFVARCALEVSDATQDRMSRIARIVEECRFGIHDISRTEPGEGGLPRFNMPFELGLFMGCKKFGRGRQRRKSCLVLDRERYRYQRFLSDISGSDVASHDGDPRRAVARVPRFRPFATHSGSTRRNWPSPTIQTWSSNGSARTLESEGVGDSG